VNPEAAYSLTRSEQRNALLKVRQIRDDIARRILYGVRYFKGYILRCSPTYVKHNEPENSSVLKNPSMPLCAFRSMIQNPAFVGFEPWFPSVLILLWALDRSDTDFFNRLVPYGKFVNVGKTYHNPQVLESPTCDDGAGRSTTMRCERSCRWCPVRP